MKCLSFSIASCFVYCIKSLYEVLLYVRKASNIFFCVSCIQQKAQCSTVSTQLFFYQSIQHTVIPIRGQKCLIFSPLDTTKSIFCFSNSINRSVVLTILRSWSLRLDGIERSMYFHLVQLCRHFVWNCLKKYRKCYL